MQRPAQPPITLVQTADAERYADLLAVTAPTVAEYCRRHGFGHHRFVGLARGCWPWHASFNRIVLLRDLVAAGEDGWIVYLDADAYVRDLDFDLAGYLAARAQHGVIVATSTITAAPWDVNSGVVMVNRAHPAGRRLVARWADALAAVTDAALAARPDWDHPDDQDWLQAILREDPLVAAGLLTEPTHLFNAPDAAFIRQRQRTQFTGFAARRSAIAADVAEVLAAAGVAPAPADDGRAAARLSHPAVAAVPLVEAPVPPADLAGARAAIARWRAPATPPGPRHRALAALLAAGDAGGLAALLAALGRAEVAEGLLGGARQHARAADRPFAAMRARRTRDALLSLAEVTGAIPLDHPERPGWGAGAAQPPAALFAAVAARLGADLSPPATVGGWLGIDTGNGGVLHARLADAIHAAAQLRDLAAAHRLPRARVLEVGGGVGLAAHYARRLGPADHRLAADPHDAVVQRHLLGADLADAGGAVDLLFLDEGMATLPPAAAAAVLRDGARRGAALLLRWGEDADPAAGTGGAVALAGGWRRVRRSRHGLRPGEVEELFVRA